MICVVGLGKVGLPLIAAIANAKYSVLGIDTDDKLVSKLNLIKKIPLEKNKSLIIKNSKQVKFVNCYSYCKNILTFFLIVPTPSKSDNSFSNKFILKALKKILIFSQKKKLFIILNSTVSPGSINKVILPFIKRNNKKKSIVEFIYNPFFIALGNVLDGIINPKSLLFGYNKKIISKKIIKIYDNLLIKNKPIFILNYEETEIAKIISNYRDTMKVSLANLIGLICNNTKNSNSDKILSFLSTRLSLQESYAGTPYGGPCWPRDNNALERSMKNKDLDLFSFMPRSIHNFNNLYSKYLIKETLKIIKNKKKITLLGLGYKSGTDETVESFAFRLYKLLKRKRKKVQAFNLSSNQIRCNKFITNLSFFNDFKKNIFTSNDVIIFTQKQNLLDFKTVKKLLNKNVAIVDYWRIYSIKHKNYYTFGNNYN